MTLGESDYSAKVERCRRLKPITGLEPLTTCTLKGALFADDGSGEAYRPVNSREAVSLACFAGSSRYTTYCNDCGGLTIATPDEGSRSLVHLDGKERFVGITNIIWPIDGLISVQGCPATTPLIITSGLHCDPIELAPGDDTYVPCSQGSAGKPPFRR